MLFSLAILVYVRIVRRIFNAIAKHDCLAVSPSSFLRSSISRETTSAFFPSAVVKLSEISINKRPLVKNNAA
jgi:hypothetical protein